MGTQDILIIRKGTVFVFDHQAMGMKDLPIAAQQKRIGIFKGSNIVCTNPTFNAKISAITA